MAEKTNFLSRLAGRTLGLVPTVQPIIVPIYAPGQQLTETENILDFSLKDGTIEDALSFDPYEQVAHRQRRRPAIPQQGRPQRLISIALEQAFPPLVPQESQTSLPLYRPEGPGVQDAGIEPLPKRRVALAQISLA